MYLTSFCVIVSPGVPLYDGTGIFVDKQLIAMLDHYSVQLGNLVNIFQALSTAAPTTDQGIVWMLAHQGRVTARPGIKTPTGQDFHRAEISDSGCVVVYFPQFFLYITQKRRFTFSQK